MNLQRIAYFVTLARTLSFTRTAEIHYVSQAAVTQQIRLLEEELGVRLFQRNNRQVVMTSEARVFYAQAVKILNLVDFSKLQMKNLAKKEHQTLSVSLVAVSNTMLFPALNAYHKKYPDTEIRFSRNSYDSLFKFLQDRTCDIGLSPSIVTTGEENISKTILANIPLYIVVNKTNRFAHMDSIKIKQLDGEQVIFPAATKEYAIASRGFLSQRGCEHLLLRTCDSPETALLNVLYADDILLCSASGLPELTTRTDVVSIPIEDMKVPVCAYWREDNPNAALTTMLEFLREYLKL